MSSPNRADASNIDGDPEKAAAARSKAKLANAWREHADDAARESEAKLAGGAFDDPSAVWRALETAARTIARMTHPPGEVEAETKRLLADAKKRVNSIRAEAGKQLLP